MAEQDQVRFLTPWTLLLPEERGKVLAVAGSGGKSALLKRLYRHYRSEGFSVLWTQTVDHPAPPQIPVRSIEAPIEELQQDFRHHAALFVAGERDTQGRARGLSPERVEDLRRQLAPDVVLVEAQAPTGTPLLEEAAAPVWPRPLHMIFALAGLHAVGRLKPRGEDASAEEAARFTSQDVLSQFTAPGGLLQQTPDEVPCFPFLAGLGSFRDLDGMFEVVAKLWETEGVKAVLLGELTGDARIDAAEEAAAAQLGGAPHLGGERIYALYPSRLDEAEG
jgi:probable selenium-dependent hydroxylase accessory protein YqeC